MTKSTVIIGGGQAGFTAADSLRRAGYSEPITIVDAQDHLPYQRPPLSKAHLGDGAQPASPHFRPADFFAQNQIDLVLDERLVSVDPERRTVTLSAGARLPYTDLVIATGSRLRSWQAPGADLEGVHRLHDMADADALRAGLVGASHLCVVGGGFIGLEVASAARKRGIGVTVIEAGERLMARALTPVSSAAMDRIHRQAGIEIVYGRPVRQVLGQRRVAGVELDDGRVIDADLVVVGIGSVPAVRADEVGVAGALDGALLVDAAMRTSLPHVWGCGDGVNFPLGPRRLRLESVQNATDQARCVAEGIVNRPRPYVAVPWFWTEQHGRRVQIAGLLDEADECVVRGEPGADSWTVFGFAGGRLVGGESVGAVRDHLAIRSMLGRHINLTADQATDPDFDLKAHSAAVPART
ncbi:FAD-dependent oxidoreductase [Streptomyces sp. NPDC046805]|uniref:NAD(P)/FAD-dependent oxidoreductase n=1 Tax=Streptomyces sp. NPDC046805 TaxID=3155134 RepID=UPI003402D887